MFAPRASHCSQVLRGFLERTVSKRLGAKKTTMFDIGGATAVKHHAFFEGIDWAKLIALQVEPPLKPDLVSSTDTSNFSTEFVDMALPRSLSQESLLSHAESLGPPGVDEVEGMFRGFSFVADTFIDEENWERVHESDGFNFMPGEGSAGPRSDAGGVGLTPQKKVKGKRVRNKKGKAKEMRAGVATEGVPSSVVGSAKRGESGKSASVAGAAREEQASGASGQCISVSQPVEEMFVREPVGGVESKPSALAVMLAAQKGKASPTSQTTSGPRRPNVWGARELPAPAPVPTPAGPPRAKPRHSVQGAASVAVRRFPAKDPMSLPGRRGDGSTFVWKRPV